MTLIEFLDNLAVMPKTDQQALGVVVLADNKLLVEDGEALTKLLNATDKRFCVANMNNDLDLKKLCQSADLPVICLVNEDKFKNFDLSGLGALVFKFSH